MTDSDFASFVASQQGHGDVASTDWNRERDDFLADVRRLYERLTEYLKEYTATHAINISYDEITVIEENIGSYTAPQMHLSIGRQTVLLEPIGTLLIGSKGRVDVVGSLGRGQIFLMDSEVRSAADMFPISISINGSKLKPPPVRKNTIVWKWKILTKDARRAFVPLDKESFYSLLMEVSSA